MLRTVLIALLLTAGLVENASAGRVAENIARMQMPVVPDQQVIVGPCPVPAWDLGESGCTWLTPEAPIYIMRASDRWTLAHEMGHRYSVIMLTQGDRDRFATIMRYRGHPPVGDERIADAYASCALGWKPSPGHVSDANFPTGRSYWPSPREQRRVCGMLRRAAERPL